MGNLLDAKKKKLSGTKHQTFSSVVRDTNYLCAAKVVGETQTDSGEEAALKFDCNSVPT